MAGCVQSCRERYGVNVILDTVRGSKTARIRQYHMEENPYYGKLSRYTIPELRQIFNDLQLQGYFHVTHDVYAIVKLTEKSRAVLDGTELVLRKVDTKAEKESEPEDGRITTRKKTSSSSEKPVQQLFLEKTRLCLRGCVSFVWRSPKKKRFRRTSYFLIKP